MEENEVLELFLNSRKAEATKRAYAFALNSLRDFTKKNFFDITKPDIAKWVDSFNNLCDTTIQQRICGVSSFYRYAIDECDLLIKNPAGGRSIRKTINPYGKATYLSSIEAGKLLASIDKTTKLGSRDYVLFLGYLILGRRNSEWRKIKFDDIFQRGDGWQYRWSGKGKVNNLHDMPLVVMNAIDNYLKLNNFTRNGYVFKGQEDNSPLSSEQVRRLLQKYIAFSGINKKVKVHSLRHTAAMLRKEVGESLEDIMRHLGHSSLSMTQIYLHSLEGNVDSKWEEVASILNV